MFFVLFWELFLIAFMNYNNFFYKTASARNHNIFGDIFYGFFICKARFPRCLAANLFYFLKYLLLSFLEASRRAYLYFIVVYVLCEMVS